MQHSSHLASAHEKKVPMTGIPGSEYVAVAPAPSASRMAYLVALRCVEPTVIVTAQKESNDAMVNQSNASKDSRTLLNVTFGRV